MIEYIPQHIFDFSFKLASLQCALASSACDIICIPNVPPGVLMSPEAELPSSTFAYLFADAYAQESEEHHKAVQKVITQRVHLFPNQIKSYFTLLKELAIEYDNCRNAHQAESQDEYISHVMQIIELTRQYIPVVDSVRSNRAVLPFMKYPACPDCFVFNGVSDQNISLPKLRWNSSQTREECIQELELLETLTMQANDDFTFPPLTTYRGLENINRSLQEMSFVARNVSGELLKMSGFSGEIKF